MTTNKAPGFERIVADASVIISLERVLSVGSGAEHLHKLFGQVLIPEKAMVEVTRFHGISAEVYCQRFNFASLLQVVTVEVDPSLPDMQKLYDAKKDHDYEGEAYAISLALREGLRILLDDTTGIAIAIKNGLKPYNLGTATLRAFRKGCLTQDEAEAILLAGCTVNMYTSKLYQQYMGLL